MLVGDASAIDEPCKPCDGDDGGFEFVGEVVDEVSAQHFGVFQLLRELIEAFGDLLEGLVIGETPSKMETRLEIAVREAVHVVDEFVDGLERELREQEREPRADDDADDTHRDENGGQTEFLVHAADDADLGKDVDRRRGESDGNEQDAEYHDREEERQGEALTALLIDANADLTDPLDRFDGLVFLIHTRFTAL